MREDSNKHPVEIIAEACGGKITSAGTLPDGSGFACVSFPLRKDHWIYQKENDGAPPMPFRMGIHERAIVEVRREGTIPEIMTRKDFADAIRAIGKYAVRASTMNGEDMDFDPDAMLQNLVVGALGYCTETGLSSLEDWMNPPHLRKHNEPMG